MGNFGTLSLHAWPPRREAAQKGVRGARPQLQPACLAVFPSISLPRSLARRTVRDLAHNGFQAWAARRLRGEASHVLQDQFGGLASWEQSSCHIMPFLFRIQYHHIIHKSINQAQVPGEGGGAALDVGGPRNPFNIQRGVESEKSVHLKANELLIVRNGALAEHVSTSHVAWFRVAAGGARETCQGTGPVKRFDPKLQLDTDSKCHFFGFTTSSAGLELAVEKPRSLVRGPHPVSGTPHLSRFSKGEAETDAERRQY